MSSNNNKNETDKDQLPPVVVPLFQYKSIPYSYIEKEIKVLKQTSKRLDKEWDNECKKYEEMIDIVNDNMNGEIQTVARRNYLNETGTVQDISLYPYHNALYPLLDAYDCLYVTDDEAFNEMHSDNIIRGTDYEFPISERYRPDEYAEGVLPASCGAIVVSLFGKNDSIGMLQNDDFLMVLLYDSIISDIKDIVHGSLKKKRCRQLFDNKNNLSFMLSSLSNKIVSNIVQTSNTTNNNTKYGIQYLPTNRHERTTILLKVLRHAMSELQRDYKLAAGVLIHMTIHHDLDDIDVYRQILCILVSEYVLCDGSTQCEEEIDDAEEMLHNILHNNNNPHPCATYRLFMGNILPNVLELGMIEFTQNHAILLSSFVRSIILKDLGTLLIDTTASSATASDTAASTTTNMDVRDRRRMLLKRAVMERRIEDDERTEDWELVKPLEVIQCIIQSISHIAIAQRNRLLEYYSEINDEGDNNNNDDDENLVVSYPVLQSCVESYYNAISALVKIAETFIQILPDNERFVVAGSYIVRSIYCCLRKEEYSIGKDDFYTYLPQNRSYLHEEKLSCSLRFANPIINATTIQHERIMQRKELTEYRIKNPTNRCVILLREFQQFFNDEPPKDVIDAIRGLYVRNLVNVQFCGIGYGDFLVWTRCKVNPQDPILLSLTDNIPQQDEDEDEDSDIELDGDEQALWDVDENDHLLSFNENKARYHFSLLLLSRAWQAPWTPESHASFQPGFRDAARMVALCSRRVGFPFEIARSINSYLHRDWWPDTTRNCWEFECQEVSTVKTVSEKFTNKKSSTTTTAVASNSLEYCRGCRIAMYCSEQCRKEDVKAGHKKICCRSPLLREQPSPEEIQLYREIFPVSNDSFIPNFLKLHLASSMVEVKKSLPSNMTDEMDEDDDEGSWETVDSDEAEEEHNSSETTRLIYDFFKTTTYDLQK